MRIIASKESESEFRWIEASPRGHLFWTNFKQPDEYGNVGARDYGIKITEEQIPLFVSRYCLQPSKSVLPSA